MQPPSHRQKTQYTQNFTSCSERFHTTVEDFEPLFSRKFDQVAHFCLLVASEVCSSHPVVVGFQKRNTSEVFLSQLRCSAGCASLFPLTPRRTHIQPVFQSSAQKADEPWIGEDFPRVHINLLHRSYRFHQSDLPEDWASHTTVLSIRHLLNRMFVHTVQCKHAVLCVRLLSAVTHVN